MPEEKEQSFITKMESESKKRGATPPRFRWADFKAEDRWKNLQVALSDEDRELVDFAAEVCHTTKSSIGRNIIRRRLHLGFGGKSAVEMREVYRDIKDKRAFAKRVWAFLISEEEESK